MKKPSSIILLSALIAIAASLLTLHFAAPEGSGAGPTQFESVYERVMRTGEIRCGYFSAPPHTYKDTKTGEISGITKEVIEKIAQNLSLKVNWVEEVSFGLMLQGLNDERYDILCSAVGNLPNRAKRAQFTEPLYYLPFFPIVRTDDTRFADGFKKLNSPAYKIAYMDGSITHQIKNDFFPNSGSLSIQEFTSSLSDVLESVATEKADVTFFWPSEFELYDKANPGQLRLVRDYGAYRVDELAFAIKYGEPELLGMLNSAIGDLHRSGFIEATIAASEEKTESFYRVAKPYRTPIQ